MQIKLLWIQPLLEITSITSLCDKVLGLWHQSLLEGAHWEPRIIPADWDSANPRGMSVKLSVIACMSGKDLRRSVTHWDGLWSALNAYSPLRLWIRVVVVAGQFCEPCIKGLRQAGAQCNPEFCQLEYIHLIRLWPVLALSGFVGLGFFVVHLGQAVVPRSFVQHSAIRHCSVCNFSKEENLLLFQFSVFQKASRWGVCNSSAKSSHLFSTQRFSFPFYVFVAVYFAVKYGPL